MRIISNDIDVLRDSVCVFGVREGPAQGSEVDGMWGRSALMHLRQGTCLSVHRK